jgi:hypothetical protein
MCGDYLNTLSFICSQNQLNELFSPIRKSLRLEHEHQDIYDKTFFTRLIGFLFHITTVSKNPLFQVYISPYLFITVHANTTRTSVILHLSSLVSRKKLLAVIRSIFAVATDV